MNPLPPSNASRRAFLRRTFVGGLGLAWWGGWGPRVLGANDRVRLAFMGTNGRGSDLIRGFAALPDAEIAAVCDVDERAVSKGVQAAGKGAGPTPTGVRDVRRLLEDRTIDALVVAAPDHWHAPATILACAAGKHVYVEKPASHNPREGELAVAAARRYRRVVQVGTQRRSFPAVIQAIDLVRQGTIGRVRFARAWYTNARGTIGHGRTGPVPAWLDWALWQGPAPAVPYRDNVVHYNWHWFWHWGTGEMGNNAVHALDLCRWGLGVTYPRQVTSGGGRYHFRDDQETPDTQTATFDFGDAAIAWEGRSCQRHGVDGLGFGVAFHGEQGTLVLDGTGYRRFDLDDKEVEKVAGTWGEAAHLRNFLECVRTGARPAADIEEGHRSTLLCQLANIAWRTGRTLRCDPVTGRINHDAGAMRLWRRTYQSGWEPKA